MSKELIRLRDVCKTFHTEPVLDHFNLYINNSEFLTLLGPSGCGKTTLLRIIGGFLTPDAGEITFDGVRINDVPPHKRQINTVFQKYALFPHLDVYENVAFGLRVAKLDEKEIDERNILQATFLAMKRALDEVREKGFQPEFALIDGNKLPRWDMKMQAIIGGDGKSISIGAASIIAKVTRDRIMTKLAEDYPQYKWDKNAGYGTKEHIEALEKYGITPYHRKSYAPIAKLLVKA